VTARRFLELRVLQKLCSRHLIRFLLRFSGFLVFFLAAAQYYGTKKYVVQYYGSTAYHDVQDSSTKRSLAEAEGRDDTRSRARVVLRNNNIYLFFILLIFVIKNIITYDYYFVIKM
jgi:hypothetical protein